MYLDRHVDRMFACDFDEMQPDPISIAPLRVKSRRVEQAAAILAKVKQPVVIVGSQAVLEAPEVDVLADAIKAMHMPVYLAGMARGLLGCQ
jgi:thiamine pyrophosphate-dependent acetolactate synthase large subunit-like protein